MDYIFKTQSLNINNHKLTINLQYLHWTEKKRLQKQNTQYQNLIQQWHTICQQQQKDKSKNDNKSSKNKQKSGTSQQTSRFGKPEGLYKKNMQWRQNVDMKVAKIRMEQQDQIQKRELMSMKQPQNKTKELIYKSNSNYKGPIKAWKQRFDSYLKLKSKPQNLQEQHGYFHPEINKNSRLLSNSSINKKVQDRLIQYGQKLKQKKAQMQIIYQEQLFLQRNPNVNSNSISKQQYSFDCTNSLDEVYFRLYKDGEKYNRKKDQYKSQFTFMPEINKKSMVLAQKIADKRKPLHPAKNQNNDQPKQEKNSMSRQYKEKAFDDFLKRNQVLLKKIQKCKEKKQKQLKQKQFKELGECTFKPNLNPKSIKIVSNRSSQKNHGQPNQVRLISNEQQSSQGSQNYVLKKFNFVKSQANDLFELNKQLQTTQRQRMSRLNSHGHIHPKTQNVHLYIGQQDSISNIHNHQEQQYQQQQAQSSLWASSNLKTTDRDRQKRIQIQEEEQLFPTPDRYNQKTEIYHIDEVAQEDSIQRGREDDWQKQLLRMQRQIEEMMHRTPTK